MLVNHGDRCDAFAEELRADGYDASAPELGERYEIDGDAATTRP